MFGPYRRPRTSDAGEGPAVLAAPPRARGGPLRLRPKAEADDLDRAIVQASTR